MCIKFLVNYEYCEDENPKSFYGVPVVGRHFQKKQNIIYH